jgi:putative transposase
VALHLNAGQVHDVKGLRGVLDRLPAAPILIADRAYDAGWLRDDLKARGISACIPSTAWRKRPFAYDKTLYKQRHKIENAFARLKDWRRIATRFDRCADIFLAAITLAVIVIFWLRE